MGRKPVGLNQLQQDAVNEAGLLEGRNVLVMAPTSSGKTMIGELAALRATQNGGRSVFLLPTKALVNEQQDKFDAAVRTGRRADHPGDGRLQRPGDGAAPRPVRHRGADVRDVQPDWRWQIRTCCASSRSS